MRKRSPGAYWPSRTPVNCPFSTRYTPAPSETFRPNAMSAAPGPGSAEPSPTTRSEYHPLAVNSTAPSPDTSALVDAAPAFQPGVLTALASEFPQTVTATAFVQTTDSTGCQLPWTAASASTPPGW